MQACHEPSDTGGANLGLQHVRTFVEAAGIPAEFCVVSRGLDADASALTALATAGELVRATEHRGARCAARKDRGRGAMRGRGAGGSCALGELLTNPPYTRGTQASWGVRRRALQSRFSSWPTGSLCW
jgi:hypothetical protein